jgi:hypothetical protein
MRTITESVSSGGRREAVILPGKTSLAEEIARSWNCDDRLLALLRNGGDPHLASLDEEDRIRRVSLGIDDVAFAALDDAPALADLGQEASRVKRPGALLAAFAILRAPRRGHFLNTQDFDC